MSCKVYTFPSFDKELKRLAKRYKSLKSDVSDLLKKNGIM